MKRSMIAHPNLTPKKPKFNHQNDDYDDHHQNQDLKVDDFDSESQFSKLDENLLYEVFKHADAKTLALASCVCKQWHHTAQDERLWELICTRHGSNSINCGSRQLRSVVLALGGFRRLHERVVKGSGSKRWGKDEVNLSLSLLSIRYYEKMNLANKKQ